jgi:DNA (cytosine-5)-methyltransferase 1
MESATGRGQTMAQGPGMMRVLDLFSGIGGFSLGLEMTKGFETVAFCEIDPFCRKVLAKHWPGIPIFEDITKLEKEELDGIGTIDVICGGFPCQDISCAGKGAGIHATRSGLWWEMLRIIRLVRPRYVLVENVAALLNRGLDEVLGSLAESGYDAEWTCLRASDFGAPHRRERIFIMAHAAKLKNSGECINENSVKHRLPARKSGRSCLGKRGESRKWIPEPSIRRVVDGFPARVDRLRGLGNAIVPQCASSVGECVLAFEEREGRAYEEPA